MKNDNVQPLDLNNSFMGTKEASRLWGVSQATVSRWCREGRIKNAEQDAQGSPWRIPQNATPPIKN